MEEGLKTAVNDAAEYVARAQRKLDRAGEYSDLAAESLGQAIHNLNLAKCHAYKALNGIPLGAVDLPCEINNLGKLVNGLQEQLDKLKRFAAWADGTDEELTEVHGGLLVAIPKGGA